MQYALFVLIFLREFIQIISSIEVNSCNPAGLENGVSYSVNSIVFNASISACGCNSTKTCVRKCCNVDYSLQNKTCVPNQRNFQVSVYQNDQEVGDPSTFSLISGLMPCDEKDAYYRLEPVLFGEDKFLVQNDGRLWQPKIDFFVDYNRYCLDYFEDISIVSALVCIPNGGKIGKGLKITGMIISMPFLLVTFLVYAVLPERNLHGKSLMCYVITLFGAYFLLVFAQINSKDISDGACRTVGLFCLFFFTVSFFWMNVMAIDIWWTFSGVRGFAGTKKQTELKRFLLYSGYAWGLPTLLLILVTCLSAFGNREEWYHPGFGDGQCWFKEGIPTLLYFYIPIATLITANVILFGRTAWTIKQVQNDTAILRRDDNNRHSFEHDKQRFNLYLRLLLAMGVNWSMEIISWLLDWQIGHIPPAVWYLTDTCNALYGVFIFFIFVFKPNIWNLLRRRYYMVMGKFNLARTITPTIESPRTTATSLS